MKISSIHLIREEKEKLEETFLFKKAAFSKNHQRLIEEKSDYRLPYRRDVDRIIHSKSYARYQDKTQVVYLIDNDHISHRSLHVQLVNNFSRNIAQILGLNVDLVEAIALGHDVGHSPFGHEGEEYLSKVSIAYGNGPFNHPCQSCRLFSEIEPLNLGFAVYDGFLCHDGGLKSAKLYPNFEKTFSDHLNEVKQKWEDPDISFPPATLEGCLVKICDTVSYLARDIEDAISLKIISREQIPNFGLGNKNSQILDVISKDIIETSYQKEYIGMSQEIFDALKALRKFNFENIYFHPKLKTESEKIRKSFGLLFQLLLEDYKEKESKSYLYQNFMHNKSEKYLNDTPVVKVIVDYIAGMTDRYFINTLHNLIIPTKIHLL